ncbi:MAG: HIT domain-containing protein [Deltaproteobacteria bacterium]|nr:HIT domain-containing protein [Deltaproteobacteria bacterium]MBW2117003.1 HIT domain-containing protein [Deltaproteobacteria bacterium]MBW2344518.1 HIT domain-containing protein [Deltaproteobacteria bacterium]
MKVMWAPWRMEYILSDQKGGECIFQTGDDRNGDVERLILYVGPLTMVMMNRYPYINGHLLVAPKRHVPGLENLTKEETLDLLVMVRKSIGVLKEIMSPEGFNVGLNLGRVAGAGVEEHMHFHIVPRWSGDTNYMTVFGEVRVIPEHIMETYRKLLPHFKELKSGYGGD